MTDRHLIKEEISSGLVLKNICVGVLDATGWRTAYQAGLIRIREQGAGTEAIAHPNIEN